MSNILSCSRVISSSPLTFKVFCPAARYAEETNAISSPKSISILFIFFNLTLSKCYHTNICYANIHPLKTQEPNDITLKRKNKMLEKVSIKILLAIFIISKFFPQAAYCSNLRELTTESLQQKSGKFECGCEYRINTVNIKWWDNFSDPYLKNYIILALSKNHDVKKNALKTEEYRQKIKTSFSKELPSLNISPTFARIKTANNQIGDIQFAQTRTNMYAIPLVAQYELDLFLKNHDKTKAAKIEKDISEYEEKAANIVMASDVAEVYINIIKLDKIIQTKTKIEKIRKTIYELTKERNKSGLASVYDVTYTDRLHTQAQIELNDLMKQRKLYLHQLAVLIDEPPMNACNLKRGNFDDLEYTNKIPEYISSETVEMRPDIMKAEAELKKAKIDIRIAKKEFLPTIPVIGIAGYNSLLIERLFNWNNIMGLVGVAAFEKIYTGGRLMANLRTKKIQFEQLLENYKQSDLNALQEINDSLCMIKFDTQKDQANLKKINLEKSNLKLIEERFKAGITSYLDYIQYQETLLSLEIEQDNSKAQRLVDYISLYKATGTKL